MHSPLFNHSLYTLLQMTHTYYTIMAAAMLAATAIGCKSHHNGEDAEVLPTVDVAQVVTDSVTLYRTYPGTLGAAQKVQLVARVSGYFTGQFYDAGDHVRKGQVLFTIEDTPYRQAVNEAKARLESAESSYTYASNQYDALRKAYESDAVSQMEVIQGKSNMESAAAAIQQAKAELTTAQTNLGYCVVRAPFDGVMSASNATVGDFLNGSGSPVHMADIYDNSALNVDFYIEDASFLRMFTNQNNRHLIDYSNMPLQFSETLPHSYSADLKYMSPDVETGTGTLFLRGSVQNPYEELRPGMYVSVNLPYKMDPKAMLVKDTSISTDQKGKYLYTVNDSNRVVYTPIKVGDLVNDSMRVVTEGVTPATRYVTSAMLKVRNGMPVKPVVVK